MSIAPSEKFHEHQRTLVSVIGILRHMDLEVATMPKTGDLAGFDLLINRKVRVEVKVGGQLARNGDMAMWKFNIHRHGLKQRDRSDFFVLGLVPVKALGMKKKAFLIVPAGDIDVMHTLTISARTMMTKWGRYDGQWSQIADLAKRGI